MGVAAEGDERRSDCAVHCVACKGKGERGMVNTVTDYFDLCVPVHAERLTLFVKQPDRALTRDQIFNAVWGYDIIVA